MNSLKISGQKAGFYPEILIKGTNGQPLPSNGVFWSVSHKDEYAAGVVSNSDIGIDLEKIKEISGPLFKSIVNDNEKKYFKAYDNNIIFFRCFTAKEAVLKALGIGIRGLSSINIVKVEDSINLVLLYKGIEFKVEHIFFDKYIASIVKDNNIVKWQVE